jgi:hypothetical protein
MIMGCCATPIYYMREEKSTTKCAFLFITDTYFRGRTLANFSVSTADAGYMEAYMNWFLTFCNVESFQLTTNLINRDLIQKFKTFQDSTRTVIYIEITKK